MIVNFFMLTACARYSRDNKPGKAPRHRPIAALARIGAKGSTQAPITGVFCIEEMTGELLQRRHRPEHRRLWRKKQFRIERRIEWRPRRRTVVDSAVSGGAAIQRIVQLIERSQAIGEDAHAKARAQ